MLTFANEEEGGIFHATGYWAGTGMWPNKGYAIWEDAVMIHQDFPDTVGAEPNLEQANSLISPEQRGIKG